MNTWTCGFRQSTSVTTPLSVIGFLSSNFAGDRVMRDQRYRRQQQAGERRQANTRDAAESHRDSRYCLLILKAPLSPWLFQVPVIDAVVEREVFDLAVDDVVDRCADLSFAVRLEVHDPAVRVQRGVLDRQCCRCPG